MVMPRMDAVFVMPRQQEQGAFLIFLTAKGANRGTMTLELRRGWAGIW